MNYWCRSLCRHKQLWRYTTWTAKDCRGTWKPLERRTHCCRKATLRSDVKHKVSEKWIHVVEIWDLKLCRILSFCLASATEVWAKTQANVLVLSFMYLYFSTLFFISLLIFFFISAAEAAGGRMGRTSEWAAGRDAEMWACPQRDAAGCRPQGWTYNGGIASSYN